MKNKLIHALAATAVATTMMAAPASSSAGEVNAKVVAEGKKLAFSRSQGKTVDIKRVAHPVEQIGNLRT